MPKNGVDSMIRRVRLNSKSIKYHKYQLVDFGRVNKDEQIRILETFLDIKDMLLFKHFKFDWKHFTLRALETEKDFFFEDFMEGCLSHYEESHTEILQEKIISLLCSIKNISSNIEETEPHRERMWKEFLMSKGKSVSGNILSEIKEIIMDSFWNEPRPEIDAFINSRAEFRNNEMLSNKTKYFKSSPEWIWYRARGIEEIKKAMEIEETYKCVVIEENQPFSNHKYVLDYEETASDYSLFVRARDKQDFRGRVTPTILSFSNIEIIHWT